MPSALGVVRGECLRVGEAAGRGLVIGPPWGFREQCERINSNQPAAERALLNRPHQCCSCPRPSKGASTPKFCLSNLVVDNLPHRKERFVALQLIYMCAFCTRRRHRFAPSGPLVPNSACRTGVSSVYCASSTPVTLPGLGDRAKGRFKPFCFLPRSASSWRAARAPAKTLCSALLTSPTLPRGACGRKMRRPLEIAKSARSPRLTLLCD